MGDWGPDVRERTVETNGVELHVVEAGEGLPVILAHGFPELAYSWRHQIPALAAAGYHVLAPDQRGYGGSSRPEAIEDYDLPHLAGDLLGTLFIEKRGEGIHHICLRVDNIEEHLERLKKEGYRLVNEAPVPGAHGCRVAFLHPSAGNGVLIELSEKVE